MEFVKLISNLEKNLKIQKKISNLKPGDIFWDYEYKYHILANLHDEEQVVFKYFGKNKRWWHYSIESYFWFELRMSVDNNGKTVGGRKPIKFKLKRK